MDLRGKRVLVTGVTGLIGGHLAERLLAEGALVCGMARRPEKATTLVQAGAELVVGDITDPASLAAAVEDCQVIYHAAGAVSESAGEEHLWRVNVEGTRNVAQAAALAGVSRFIHISSCAVYGSLQAFGIDESFPPRQTGSAYHRSKVAAEAVVFAAAQQAGLPVVVPRPSQVYGPRSEQFTLRPIQAIQSGKMFLIDGGRHLCKPVYVDNLIDGLVLCGQQEVALGEAINLCDDHPVPWRVFFGAYANMLGVGRLPSLPYPVAWLMALAFEAQARVRGKSASVTRRAIASLRSTNSFSNRKAKALLGWRPRYSLEEGMQRTRDWLAENGYLAQGTAGG